MRMRKRKEKNHFFSVASPLSGTGLGVQILTIYLQDAIILRGQHTQICFSLCFTTPNLKSRHLGSHFYPPLASHGLQACSLNLHLKVQNR